MYIYVIFALPSPMITVFLPSTGQSTVVHTQELLCAKLYGKSNPSNNPFLHTISTDGKITYIKKYDNDFDTLIMFTAWLAWEPETIFFQSMLNSGKLLEIKNKKLRTEIESIYTKQEERVDGMAKFTLDNCAPIQDWFLEMQNKVKNDISLKDVFERFRNQELKNS